MESLSLEDVIRLATTTCDHIITGIQNQEVGDSSKSSNTGSIPSEQIALIEARRKRLLATVGLLQIEQQYYQISTVSAAGR